MNSDNFYSSTVPVEACTISKQFHNRDYFVILTEEAQFKKSNLQEDYEIYVYSINQASHKIQNAKSQYYVDALNENVHHPKKLWKVPHDLDSSRRCKTKSCFNGIDTDNGICFEQLKTVGHFNTFFTTFVVPPVSKLPTVNYKFETVSVSEEKVAK